MDAQSDREYELGKHKYIFNPKGITEISTDDLESKTKDELMEIMRKSFIILAEKSGSGFGICCP